MSCIIDDIKHNCNYKKWNRDWRSKVHKQAGDQRNGAKALLENQNISKNIYYPYSDCIRFLLADVIAVRIGLANAFSFFNNALTPFLWYLVNFLCNFLTFDSYSYFKIADSQPFNGQPPYGGLMV